MRTQAEAAVLAAVLNGANPTDVRITGASFYDPRDGQAWTAMLELTGEGIRPDVASVAIRTANADPDHLRLLVDRDINPGSLQLHAAEVAAKASRRALTDIAYRIHAAAESDEPYDRIIEKARAALDNAVLARQDARTLAEIYPDLVESMRAGKLTGLSTPWPDLDRHIVGLQPGRLYTIAARTGVGKTIAAQNIAEHMSLVHRKRVYFSTLEMSDDELALRFLSCSIGIDSKKLQSGHLTAAEWHAVEAAGQSGFVDMAVDICSTPTQTIETIRSGARDTSRKGDLGLIVVDYLQLMEGAGKDKNRTEVVSGFTRGLKNIASEFQVPVIALSQLNRAAVGVPPNLSHLRESGSIEQDSDVVLLLHEDVDQSPGIVTVFVAKARNGSLGQFDLSKFGRFSSFRSPDDSSPLRAYYDDQRRAS